MANNNQAIKEEGQVYERLTVIKRGPDQLQTDGKFRALWWCECSCGNACVLVLGKSLRSGRTKSCGCIRKEKSRARQIERNQSNKKTVRKRTKIGDKYGMLTVTKKAQSIKYASGSAHAAFYCKCDCGNPELLIKTGNYLRSTVDRVLQSCGCAESQRKKDRIEKESPLKERKDFHMNQLAFYAKVELVGEYINEKTSTEYTCLLHGKTYKALPMNMQRGRGLRCCKLSKVGADSVKGILDCTLRAPENEAFLYAFEMANYPGLVKIGVALDIETRADKEYGDLICAQLVKSRIIAVALESALKDKTFHLHELPDELSNWPGRTEVRKVDNERIQREIDFLIEEYKDLGLWRFLLNHTNITEKEKEEIRGRVTETEPVYDW